MAPKPTPETSMHEVPQLPDVADAPDVLSGHLWLQELVDGTPLRFQVQERAPIRFGDDRRIFDPDDGPRELRYALHEIHRNLDRGALRQAVEDVESITFVGIGTHKQHVDYDWQELPGFLGTDIWDADAGDAGEWLPPDRAEQVFETLGLSPVTAIEKEVRAMDFQPDRYEFPDSEWRTGPAAGVVVRNKTGGRALLENSDVLDAEPTQSIDVDHELDPAAAATMLAEEFATDALFRRTADEIAADDARSVTFDSLQTAVLDACYREYAPTFEGVRIDEEAFRRAVAARTSGFIGTSV